MALAEAILLDQREIAVSRSWATHARSYRLAPFSGLVSLLLTGSKAFIQY
jgi:hypothetical protein